jgi:hypothetical protein
MTKETYKRLKHGLEELKEHNAQLERCLNIKNSASRSQSFPEMAPPAAVQNSAQAVVFQASTSQGSQQQQALCTMLYRALANVPPCNCHLLHLDLGWCGNNTGFSLLVKSNLNETQLSLAPGFGLQNAAPSDLLIEVVTAFPNTSSATTLDASISLCPTLFTSQAQANYLLGDFVLKSIHRPQPCSATHSASITLHDMIREPKVTFYDRTVWASKLTNAAVSFYSSPWIKGWTTHAIRFFVEYEQSSEPASWRPHIPTTLGSTTPCLSDMEVHSLGLMLLEIGKVDIEEFNDMPYSQALDAALRDLTKEMGRPYRKVAERCFTVYQESMRPGASRESCIAALSQEIAHLQKHIETAFSF